MLPTIELGPLVIPTGGLVYILGAWLVLSVVERSARRLALDVPATYGTVVMGLAGGFVGARLVFVALHWEAYAQSPLAILWPLNSGFALWGGLLIGGAAAFFYARARQLPPAGTLDALAPVLVVGLMVVSLADFLAGPGYGSETTLFWAIDLFGVRRHPVQLYELLVGGLALVSWWYALRAAWHPGRAFLLTVAVYSAGRLFVEAYRANAWLTGDGYHVVQLLCLALLLGSLFLLARTEPVPAGPSPDPDLE